MASLKFLCCLLAIYGIVVCVVRLSQANSCYQCRGIECSVNDSKIVPCPKGLCFILTIEVYETYRSCYTETDPYFIHCSDYRFSSCRVCQGELCNDWPLIQYDNSISCAICDRGICTSLSDTPGVRKCPLFRTPELPRCYSIVDRYSNEYTFGCANEMTIEQIQLCEKDYFQSVCRYCDTPNCNKNNFFASVSPASLKCYSNQQTPSTIQFCARDNNAFPYYGCYVQIYEGKTERQYGCLSDYFRSPDANEYLALFTKDMKYNMVVCFKNACNYEFVDKDNHPGLTPCDGRWCGTMQGEGNICGQYTYKDTYGEVQSEIHCMSRFPCWRAEECPTACRYDDDSALITDSCLKPMACYTCNKCANINPGSPANLRACTSNTTTCFTRLSGLDIVRGCHEGDSVKACADAGPEMCQVCADPGCNKDSFGVFCHQCSHFNPMCPYQQQATLGLPCKVAMDDLDDYTRCYSEQNFYGQVTRGCTNTDTCPTKDAKRCKTCRGNFCNYESFVTAECLSCVGTHASLCGKDVQYLTTKVHTKECPVGYETPHCYMAINASHVIRGCVADSNYYASMQRLCIIKYSCFFCDNENCNYFKSKLVDLTNEEKDKDKDKEKNIKD